MRKRWRWLAGAALAGAVSAVESGCLNFAHPVPASEPEVVHSIKTIPEYARNRVYIFLIQGNDPNEFSNFVGVRDHLNNLGFIKTYYGYLWHVKYFADEIRRIRDREPDSRFIVCGFSVGGKAAWKLARAVEPDDIELDLVLYLDAVTLDEGPASRPNNADRVVHICSSGWFVQASPTEGVENFQVEVQHHGVPTHPRTLELFTEELAASALRVPIPMKVLPAPSISPTPRPLLPPPTPTAEPREVLPVPRQAPQGTRPPPPPRQARPEARKDERDEWDFLKADSEDGPRGRMPGYLAPMADGVPMSPSQAPAQAKEAGKGQKGEK